MANPMPTYEECKRAVDVARFMDDAGARGIDPDLTLTGEDFRALLHAARIGLNVLEPDAREEIERLCCEHRGYPSMTADAILSLLTGGSDA